MPRFLGVGDRIKARLEALGYWRDGRADVGRFCREHGYDPRGFYAWLRGRVPATYLNQLARDLRTTPQQLLHGGDGPSQRPRPARSLLDLLREAGMNEELATAIILLRRIYVQSVERGNGEAWKGISQNIRLFASLPENPEPPPEPSAEEAREVTPPVTPRRGRGGK